ncbi:MAG TPA: hypothetical protein VMM76_10150 [Pirellulaceae bacterium]|nr:hypothetical protein [Pirellulaceae bacterium]
MSPSSQWACLTTQNVESIQQDLRWNQPAERKSGLIASAVRNNRTILDEIRLLHPSASIAHWLGPGKLSIELADELEELFASGIPNR